MNSSRYKAYCMFKQYLYILYNVYMLYMLLYLLVLPITYLSMHPSIYGAEYETLNWSITLNYFSVILIILPTGTMTWLNESVITVRVWGFPRLSINNQGRLISTHLSQHRAVFCEGTEKKVQQLRLLRFCVSVWLEEKKKSEIIS